MPSKWALLLCLVGEAISLFVFTYAQDFAHLSLGRFFSGACQVVLAIFLPVWVDAFAPSDKKTLWMTLSISANVAGTLCGYGLAAAVVTAIPSGWWWAFYILIAAMIAPIVYLATAEASILDVKEHLRQQQEEEVEEQEMATMVNDLTSEVAASTLSHVHASPGHPGNNQTRY